MSNLKDNANDAPVELRASALNESFHNKNGAGTSGTHFGGTNRFIIAVVVYFALLLDNMLLTVIVPILPDYLASINNGTYHTSIDLKFVTTNGGSSNVNTLISQHAVYRNADGSQSSQPIITKHPIPGKSMMNFSLLHVIDDKTSPEQNQNQVRQPVSGSSSKNLNNASNTSFPTGTTFITNIPTVNITEENLNNENSLIGILLAMKALVQLIFNPIVGNMSTKFGYRLLIVMGTFCLLISSLVFAIGESYISLIIARAIHGVGSACIGVCGMSLVAQHYPEEDRRSKVMGVILGSIALGVLLGYPFGGILYDLIGKSAPFMILSTIIFINLGMQLLIMDLSVQSEVVIDSNKETPKWTSLLQSKMVLAIVVAIWISTSTMALLEPILPIYLKIYLKATKWQLGTVFIPDSIGYFVGTNFFGSIAYQIGQVKISCMSLILVGIASVMIPTATTVSQLLLPHFGLGLGIGVIDAALVPLLATFVDETQSNDEQNDVENRDKVHSVSSYGSVYAIQQTSVSLAYCLAPLIGGEMAQALGFPWLMRIVGSFNIIYGPILVYLYQKYDPKLSRNKQNQMLLADTERSGSQYKHLYNSIDTE